MIIIGFGIVIALAAAARSTWSPCGLSMLSQITPMAEAGRGHKFARTAAVVRRRARCSAASRSAARSRAAAIGVGRVGVEHATVRSR